jgi:hypothetical protein
MQIDIDLSLILCLLNREVRIRKPGDSSPPPEKGVSG